MILHVKNAFFYSLDGFKAAIKEETAFRIVVLQAIVMIVIMMMLPFTYVQKAMILITVALSLIVELLNSSLENIVDLITSDWHILAKKAKDMGSAAQFIASALIYLNLLLILMCDFQ